MTRKKPNFIALGCALAYTLCFCLLPFFHVVVMGLSGWNMMQHINPIMCVPLALGILMMLTSMLIDIRVSIGAGALTFVATLVLMLCGGSIVMNGNALTQLANTAVSQYVGVNLSSALPISVGIGSILCLIASLVFVGAEIAIGMQKPPMDINLNSINDFDSNIF